MKKKIFLICLFFSAYLMGQPNYQYKWIPLYNTNPNKIMVFNPSKDGILRYSSIALIKELRYRWGLNYHYWGNFKDTTYFNRIISAGYDLQHIIIFIEPLKNNGTVYGLQSSLVSVYPHAFAYMVDEPAYNNYQTSWLVDVRDTIDAVSPESKYIITSFNNSRSTYNIMNNSRIYPDEIVCDRYDNTTIGIFWSILRSQYSSRFNYVWLATHRNLSTYSKYIHLASQMGLGVWLWQFNDPVPDDANIDQFAYYASLNGFLTFDGYQYVRDRIVDGIVTQRQFVGPIYSRPTSPPTNSYTLSNIVVDDLRVFDYWASNQITAQNYSIPSGDSSTFVAANKIDLKNGFHAHNGSYFHASSTEISSRIIYNKNNKKAIIANIESSTSQPITNELTQNFPNPFNPITNIRYSVKDAGLVIIKVFNDLGQEVSTLVNDIKQPGTYEVNFNASTLPSGIYFYRMQSGNFVSTKKLVLLK